MIKVLKTIGINILVLLAFLMVIDFGAMIIVDIFTVKSNIRQKMSNGDPRRNLPNYENIPWARAHFKEFNLTSSDYKSYYGWRRKAFRGETINIDTFGIRKTTGQIDKKAPIAVFLGGSTMWGSGANDENTIPSLFKNTSKKDYIVLNYGETGYNTYQSFIFLQTQIAKGLLNDVDLIVTCDGVNNAYYFKKWFSHFREDQINNLLKWMNCIDEYLFMKNTKVLINKIKIKYFNLTPPLISEDMHKQAAIELLESWLMIKKLAEIKTADFVCILQPNAFVGNPDIENIEEVINNSFRNSYKYYKYVRKYIYERERYKTLKSHFIDMTNIFDDIPNVYIDFCHVSPNGNKLIVNNLLNLN